MGYLPVQLTLETSYARGNSTAQACRVQGTLTLHFFRKPATWCQFVIAWKLLVTYAPPLLALFLLLLACPNPKVSNDRQKPHPICRETIRTPNQSPSTYSEKEHLVHKPIASIPGLTDGTSWATLHLAVCTRMILLYLQRYF